MTYPKKLRRLQSDSQAGKQTIGDLSETPPQDWQRSVLRKLNLIAVLTAILAALSTVSCGGRSSVEATAPAPPIICPKIPPHLLLPTPMPEIADSATWRDVAALAIRRAEAISACNADKSAAQSLLSPSP